MKPQQHPIMPTQLQEDTPALVEAEKEKPGKKKKPKVKEVLVTCATRQRKKAITSVEGLELFGIKLADAAKVFGKKYACGASVVTNPSLKEQIDIQGDVQELIPELILEKYGKSHGLEARNLVMIVDKQRVSYDEF
jgi:density-regulated protein DRP1